MVGKSKYDRWTAVRLIRRRKGSSSCWENSFSSCSENSTIIFLQLGKIICGSFGLISTLRNQLTFKVKAASSGVLISVYLDAWAFSTAVRPNFWHWEGQISSWSDWRMMDLIWTERWSTIMPMIDQGELMVWSLGGTEKIGGAACLGPEAVH